MESFIRSQDKQKQSRAASAASKQNVGGREERQVTQSQIVQQKLQDAIENSPQMTAQREQVSQLGDAAQLVGPKEEELAAQGQFATQLKGPHEEDELAQGKFAAQRVGNEEEEMTAVQGKIVAQRAGDQEHMASLQQKAAVVAESSRESVLQKKNETGMPDGVKSQMEKAFDSDFSQVRVHENSPQASDIGALAYTQGSDIHFAPGQFKPDSSTGQQLLGHELTHVVQQSEGRVQPTTEVNGMPVNDSPALEKEADDMGSKARK